MNLIALTRVLELSPIRYLVIVSTMPADAGFERGTIDMTREYADSVEAAETLRLHLVANVHGAAAQRRDTIVHVRSLSPSPASSHSI
jgi:hypothetical protein